MREYFTQSHFQKAHKCITKLNYSDKAEYANKSKGDPFIEALANGGYQVKELAKYLFADDPETELFQFNHKDLNTSLGKVTDAFLDREKLAMFNVPFDMMFRTGKPENFKFIYPLVRVDFIQRNSAENVLNLYSVKSKPFDSTNDNLKDAKWESVLLDLAMQTFVLRNHNRSSGYQIRPHLILLDKSKGCSVDGMNQLFTVRKTENGGKEVIVKPGLKKSDLDTSILTIIPVINEVNELLDHKTFRNNVMGEVSFGQYVLTCADIYINDIRLFAPLTKECKTCQFRNDAVGSGELLSGFHECWDNRSKLGDELRNNDLITDLSYEGSKGLFDDLLAKEIYLIKDINESDIAPKSGKAGTGLTPHQRRMEQINRVKSGTKESYFDREGFLAEAASWTYPLHMIDFETATPAIPFNKNRRPYEQIAFQFSHHTIQKDGSVAHSGEFISFERGKFPNYDFLRNLKKQLEQDNGTVFRYSSHENTCLKNLHKLLASDPEPPADKAGLQKFIESITNFGMGGKKGERSMIDLESIVKKYYYSPLAKGSNSLKVILPAIINDSEFLRNKYGKPVYGKGLEVTSLNFDKHVWIDPKVGNDPYKTLPKLFADYDPETLDGLFDGLDEVNEGTAAMTAYSFLQYGDIPEKMREELRDGLLRYCELDTMAMVMLLEGLMDKAK